MLNEEFVEFINTWLSKAQSYNSNKLKDCYDKFFTLYVVFNRLYGEITFELNRNGKIKLSKKNSFPDSKAAKDYVCKSIGSKKILEKINNNLASRNSLDSITNILENRIFNIKLDKLNGFPQPDLDQQLLNDLKSQSSNKKALAILDIIYSVRCNLFHGHKQFIPIQADLLNPINIILIEIVKILFEKLNESY